MQDIPGIEEARDIISGVGRKGAGTDEKSKTGEFGVGRRDDRESPWFLSPIAIVYTGGDEDLGNEGLVGM